MASKHIRTDMNFAYPTAEIAVMGPEGAVNIVYERIGRMVEERSRRQIQEFEEFRSFANPYLAADRGYIDEVIEPRDTRRKLIDALKMLDTKRIRTHPRSTGISAVSHGPMLARHAVGWWCGVMCAGVGRGRKTRL